MPRWLRFIVLCALAGLPLIPAVAQDAEPARVIVSGQNWIQAERLEAGMADPDPAVRQEMFRLAAKSHLPNTVPQEMIEANLAPTADRADRLAAARILASQTKSKDDSTQVADLIRLLQDIEQEVAEVGLDALELLARAGKVDRTSLEPLARHPDLVIRFRAACVRAAMGDAALLLPFVEAEDEGISRQAALGLEYQGKGSGMDRLIAERLLETRRLTELMRVLRVRGRLASEAYPALLALLPRADAKMGAIFDLAAICRKNPELLAEVERLAKAEGPSQAGAIVALAHARREQAKAFPPEMVDRFSRELAAPTAEARIAALKRLCSLNEMAARSVPQVRKLLVDADSTVRRTALTTLRCIGAPAVEAVREVAAFVSLEVEEPERLAAAACLGQMQPHSPQADELIAGFLAHSDRRIRLAGLRAFEYGAKASVAHVRRFAAIYANADEEEAAAGGKQLKYFVSFHRPRLPEAEAEIFEVLARQLRQGPVASRRLAVEILGEFEKRGRSRVPELLGVALRDSDRQVRLRALAIFPKLADGNFGQSWAIAECLGEDAEISQAAADALRAHPVREPEARLRLLRQLSGRPVLPAGALDVLTAWGLGVNAASAPPRALLLQWLEVLPPAQQATLRAQATFGSGRGWGAGSGELCSPGGRRPLRRWRAELAATGPHRPAATSATH